LEAAWQTGLVLDLHDDGTGGDKVAGDATYSLRFAPAALLASMRADDVFRLLIGFVKRIPGTDFGGPGFHDGRGLHSGNPDGASDQR
jgi:hypothetical protein